MDPGTHLFDSGAGDALAEFHAFASTISDAGFDGAMHQWVLRFTDPRDLPAILNTIADRLSNSMEGVSKDIFSKSVVETLYIAAQLEGEMDIDRLKDGIADFLKRRGPAELLQRLVYWYAFNTVWFRIQDRVQLVAGGPSIERIVGTLESACLAIVESVLVPWTSENTPSLLSPALARQFLAEIEDALEKRPQRW